jgi:acyl-CoA ligase (AMP-forming) (exosortase A-associated)
MAERRPEAECLLTSTRTVTFGALDGMTARLGSALVSLGVRAGDRVCVHLDKSVEEAVSLLAVNRAGGVFVNANLQLKSPQLHHILVDSGARVLVVAGARASAICSALGDAPALEHVICIGSPPEDLEWPENVGVHIWEPLLAGADAGFGEVRRVDADPAGIIYTSGSTGLPKGVVVSHRNLVAGAESVADYLGNTPDDVVLSVLPFSFDYGLNQLMCTLLVGMRLVLQRFVGPADILSAARKFPITGLAGIPPIWTSLADLPFTQGEHFPHLRYITNSGGAFPPTLVEQYRQRLPSTRIFLMYGLTEAFRATYLPPEELDRRPGSIGKAIPNAEILLLNDAGEPCKPREVGQIVQRGAHVALGYWNDPERTRQRYQPNPAWPAAMPLPEMAVFSGDYAWQDEEGYLFFIGRRDEMIKTAGYRVSPTEVEDHFHRTGLVRDAVAVGVDHAQLGQCILMVCSLAAGVTADEARLLAVVEHDMPRYMVPKRVFLLPELARNANGKLDRSAITRAVREGTLT